MDQIMHKGNKKYEKFFILEKKYSFTQLSQRIIL